MVRELRQRGYTASKGRVERQMREHRIRARHKLRYRVTKHQHFAGVFSFHFYIEQVQLPTSADSSILLSKHF
jgi:hypothetical protein